jgi:hypothetical protein
VRPPQQIVRTDRCDLRNLQASRRKSTQISVSFCPAANPVKVEEANCQTLPQKKAQKKANF